MRYAGAAGVKHVAAAVHARIESLAQALFHGAETGADIVDAMDDDDIARQFRADAHDGVLHAAQWSRATLPLV